MFGYLIDNIILAENFNYLYPWMIISLITIIISSFLTFYFIQFIITKKSILNSEKVSNKLIKNLLSMSIGSYEKNDKGFYFNVLTNSAFTYADLHAQYYLEFICSISLISLILIISFIFNKYLSILLLIFIPIVIVSSKSKSSKLANLQKDAMENQDIFFNDLRSIIDRKREITILKEEMFFTNKFKSSMRNWVEFILKYKFLNCLIENIPQIISNIYNIILLGIGAILISQNKLSPGVLIMGYQFLGYLSTPVINCTQILIRLKANKEHITRVENLENLNIKRDEHSEFRKDSEFLFNCKSFSLCKNDLNKEVLFKGTNIQIQNTGLYIIKGKNGTGKSSFINYILGYSDINLAYGDFLLSNKIDNSAFLTYPTILINGSFKENLFNKDFDKTLLQVLNIDFEDKIINSNPANLSLGEQQKLALLRVLSMDFKYLFLDEPLSNLDSATQENLLKYLSSLKTKKAIVVIMHDNYFDDISDSIYIIEDNELRKDSDMVKR